jgi:hypothetical protein
MLSQQFNLPQIPSKIIFLGEINAKFERFSVKIKICIHITNPFALIDQFTRIKRSLSNF